MICTLFAIEPFSFITLLLPVLRLTLLVLIMAETTGWTSHFALYQYMFNIVQSIVIALYWTWLLALPKSAIFCVQATTGLAEYLDLGGCLNVVFCDVSVTREMWEQVRIEKNSHCMLGRWEVVNIGETYPLTNQKYEHSVENLEYR